MDPFVSASELARSIAQRELSPVEAVECYLERIDRYNRLLNAVTWRRDEDVRREAREAEAALMAGRPLGPLFGVPIPVKDLTDVAGWPISFGSRAARGRTAKVTAAVIAALREAGCLLLCRTNTPEFGLLPVTENLAYGATRNPWDPERTPGGSSGGAAACVAAGLAPLAHGNDGGGSIRIPASCCGLVGLKASRGRVSWGPVVCDVMHGGAVEGALTRSVEDAALVLDVISRPDPLAWYNAPPPERPFRQEVGAPPGRLRVAVTSNAPTGVPVAPECVEAVERTAALLADLGHEVFEGHPEWPDPSEILGPFMTVWNTSLAYWDVEDWDQVEPLSRAMLEQARTASSFDYVRALIRLQMASRQIVAAWGRDFDVLLTPTIATLPPKIGALYEGADANPLLPIVRASEMAAFTPLFNVTGQPAISLPLHWTADGLPVGVQLVGRPWGESDLIRLASQLEEAAPWKDRRPPLEEKAG